MDRFIVDTNGRLLDLDIDLKSNMDRFIVAYCTQLVPGYTFKIQYG